MTYVPPPPPDGEEEIFRKIATGINFDKYDHIAVKFTGENPNEPINLFTESGLNQMLMDNLNKANYERPTPVQKYAIPAGIQGRDLMACAQTGSGKTVSTLAPLELLLFFDYFNIYVLDKTAAVGVGNTLLTFHALSYFQLATVNYSFSAAAVVRCLLVMLVFFQAAYLLPAMQNMLSEGLRSPQLGEPVHTLIIAPVRELADQIQKECVKFSYRAGIKSVAVYGGVATGHQIAQLERGCHMVVGTPGRLIDMIGRGKVGALGCMYT